MVGACLSVLSVGLVGQYASAAAGVVDSLPPLKPHATILAFGDSLTEGVGGSGDNYPDRLAQLIHREVINGGMPGETTADGRRRLPAELLSSRPDFLILCLGINDFLQKVPADQIRGNLLALLALAHESGVPVLLVAVPRPGTAVADPVFADVASTAGVAVDNRSMVEVLSNPALKAGLVHPNSDGYRLLSENLGRRLIALGALPEKR